MARPPSQIPKVKIKVSLEEAVVAKLDLICMDPVTGTIKDRSKVINDVLKNWVLSQFQPPK